MSNLTLKEQSEILRKSAGMFKGVFKKSGVALQREMRNEWEDRLKRQYKITSKKQRI